VADARPGLREVLLVAVVVVAAVLGAALLTGLLPAGAQDVIFRTPLLIAVLVGGTIAVLWQISRPRPPRG
jgi:peptidoglycan/LPS O-acetylase OafA/YrhL